MILTVGHSNHALERFLELLGAAGISAVADVRSSPHSRWSPQFNTERLSSSLSGNGIAYVFLGNELGGRPKDPALLTAGKPDYGAMARSASFQTAIARLIEGSKTHRIALMCAERDPIDCHRFLMIARHLAKLEIPVAHILAGGEVEQHEETERRIAERNPIGDLFK